MSILILWFLEVFCVERQILGAQSSTGNRQLNALAVRQFAQQKMSRSEDGTNFPLPRF
jgi:hypothetical protein